jgi:hypothetical protein
VWKEITMSTRLLEDKIVLVSGGSRGLGAGIARAAADAGAAGIMITGRDPVAVRPLLPNWPLTELTSSSTLLILPIRKRPPGV